MNANCQYRHCQLPRWRAGLRAHPMQTPADITAQDWFAGPAPGRTLRCMNQARPPAPVTCPAAVRDEERQGSDAGQDELHPPGDVQHVVGKAQEQHEADGGQRGVVVHQPAWQGQQRWVGVDWFREGSRSHCACCWPKGVEPRRPATHCAPCQASLTPLCAVLDPLRSVLSPPVSAAHRTASHCPAACISGQTFARHSARRAHQASLAVSAWRPPPSTSCQRPARSARTREGVS